MWIWKSYNLWTDVFFHQIINCSCNKIYQLKLVSAHSFIMYLAVTKHCDFSITHINVSKLRNFIACMIDCEVAFKVLDFIGNIACLLNCLNSCVIGMWNFVALNVFLIRFDDNAPLLLTGWKGLYLKINWAFVTISSPLHYHATRWRA